MKRASLRRGHAHMLMLKGKQISKGIEDTKFTFRDAEVPRTRPWRRLQGLTGETPAAANDSSQQTAEDHFPSAPSPH